MTVIVGEVIAVKGINVTLKVFEESNKDVLFYDDAPDMYFQLTDGQFAIFFPEDVHAPMIGGDAEIKKLVIKVKL